MSGRRSGRGTHGSITKAGKVRNVTPQLPKTSTRERKGPRITNRRKFISSLYNERFKVEPRRRR